MDPGRQLQGSAGHFAHAGSAPCRLQPPFVDMTHAGGKPLVATGVKYAKKDVLMLFDYFVQLDKDKDNKIRVSEVLEGYKNKSLKLPMNSTDFIRTLDVNHDGVVTFDELLKKYYPFATEKELKTMYRGAVPEPGVPREVTFEPSAEQLAEMSAIFALWDKNKDRVLDIKEVLALGKATGYDEEELQALFRGADVNHDNVLSLDEFVQLMKGSYISQ